MKMPPLNKRISDLIDEQTGNVSAFVKLLNEGKKEGLISQQKMDRLFHIDNKTGDYPKVPFDIIEAIVTRFPDLDSHWLITGQKKSGTAAPDKTLLPTIQKEIQIIQISLENIAKAAGGIVDLKKLMDHPPMGDLSLDKRNRSEGLKKGEKHNLSGKGK